MTVSQHNCFLLESNDQDMQNSFEVTTCDINYPPKWNQYVLCSSHVVSVQYHAWYYHGTKSRLLAVHIVIPCCPTAYSNTSYYFHGLGLLHVSCCLTVLLSYCLTVLLSCCPTILLSRCTTVLLIYIYLFNTLHHFGTFIHYIISVWSI